MDCFYPLLKCGSTAEGSEISMITPRNWHMWGADQSDHGKSRKVYLYKPTPLKGDPIKLNSICQLFNLSNPPMVKPM